MAISLIATASLPAVENQTLSTAGDSIGPDLTVDLPAGVVAGDLLVLAVNYRGTATPALTVSGGQQWVSGTVRQQSNAALRVFSTVYTGVWQPGVQVGGNGPTVSVGTGTAPMQVTLLVFRSTLGGFSANVAETGGIAAAPTSPFDCVSPSFAPTAGALAVAWFATADDNDWVVQTANWVGGRRRNQAGSDQSLAWAYRLSTPSGAQTVTVRQTALGGDAYARSVASWVESAPPRVASAGVATVSMTAFAPKVTPIARPVVAVLSAVQPLATFVATYRGLMKATWTLATRYAMQVTLAIRGTGSTTTTQRGRADVTLKPRAQADITAKTL